ncbi:MAG: NusG domain II-containing protein [Lachnospiraceae bacterium]|nr:NusG domain II-containing protein [Lachnospiraceae bacterium]
MKLVKRNDYILLLGVLLFSALLFGAFRLKQKTEDGAWVLVSIKGAEYARYSLFENRTEELPGPLGHNRLVVKDGMVWMEDAVCPDKYCIKQGKISKTGQQIICLPNGIIIEIIGGEETGLDAVVS